MKARGARLNSALAVADVAAALIEWRAATKGYDEAIEWRPVDKARRQLRAAAGRRLTRAERDLAEAADVWLAQIASVKS